MIGEFLEIFVEIPIGTFFSENFPFWRFAIDNHVFRVFVEVPIGKILALFDVFSATRWAGGRSAHGLTLLGKVFFDDQIFLDIIFSI